MKIGFVIMYVSDFAKALDFYSNVLEMEIDFSDKTNWAQFNSGADVSLALEKCSLDRVECGAKLIGRFAGVTFMVDDIAATYQKLKSKGVKFSGEPEKQHFGGTLAHFHDPDGNVLTLMQEAPER